jgi:hypothetical protein
MDETARLLLVLFGLSMAALMIWSADGEEDPALKKADDGSKGTRPTDLPKR